MGGQDPKEKQSQNTVQKKVQNEHKKGQTLEAYGRGHQRDRKDRENTFCQAKHGKNDKSQNF